MERFAFNELSQLDQQTYMAEGVVRPLPIESERRAGTYYADGAGHGNPSAYIRKELIELFDYDIELNFRKDSAYRPLFSAETIYGRIKVEQFRENLLLDVPADARDAILRKIQAKGREAEVVGERCYISVRR